MERYEIIFIKYETNEQSLIYHQVFMDIQICNTYIYLEMTCGLPVQVI